MKGIPKQNLLVGGLGYVDPGYIAKKILDCFREASFAGLKVLTPIKVGSLSQWLFLVPLKGGIGGIVHPPIGRKNTTYNTTYSPCRTWGVICYLLGGSSQLVSG